METSPSAAPAYSVPGPRPFSTAPWPRTLAAACGSPAEVAQRSEFILSLVSDAVQTDDVVFGESGILNTLREQAVFIIGDVVAFTASWIQTGRVRRETAPAKLVAPRTTLLRSGTLHHS